MHITFLCINALLCLLLPIALGILLRRRLGAKWSLLFWGALTFICAQVVHIPLNFGVGLLWKWDIVAPLPEPVSRYLLPIALGLSAGLCEEIARWLFLRTQRLSTVRTWNNGLMYGAGHGGVEALIIGLLAAFGAVNVIVLQLMNPESLGLTPEQLEQVSTQLAAVFDASPWLLLLGAFERLCAMTMHLAFALLVMTAVLRRQLRWLAASIALHTAFNAFAVFILKAYGALAAEGAIFTFALFAICILLYMRQRLQKSVRGETPDATG